MNSLMSSALAAGLAEGLRDNPVINYAIAVFIVVALIYLAILQFWVLLRTRKHLSEMKSAYSEIEIQRSELQLRNKDLTDSLNYARRIQAALLPSEHHIRRIFPDYFIYYRPKHIVSGDFYWFSERDDKYFIAAADCTGHGVPGALMSMIGLELINKIINEMKVDDSDQVLLTMNRELESAFFKEESGKPIIKDGIEMSICIIDKKTRVMEFSGAFLPVYIVRDDKLIEIKGDKKNVVQSFAMVSFNRSTFTLQEGDLLYLFSDGYADQFGGPENKKFMYRRLRHILLTISKYPLPDQQRILDETIDSWMEGHDQIDDMMILGVRPF
ncbi:MAG: SpoIIE family protein phosphatase [Bacteroidales bacterium]|nr:SpoIIE family protein phosphatase [Bacteroidales bacterium]